MKLTGTVHSCSPGSFPVMAAYDGKEIAAMVRGITIEVVGESRSWTFDIVTDLDETQKLFAVGSSVTISLEIA